MSVESEDVLARAMWKLYAASAADFLAQRALLVSDAKARGADDAAALIQALRKPTRAASAINHAVRARGGALDVLLQVGATLRTAQARFDAAKLNALRGARDDALESFVDAVAQTAVDAGAPLSSAVLIEIRDTAVAALADGDAAAAVKSGALTRALSYAGFGEVDTEDAVAYLASGAVLTVIDGGGLGSDDEIDPLDHRDDATIVAAAQAALEAADRAVREAQKRARRAEDRIVRLKEQLSEAKDEAEAATAAVREASRAQRRAQADRKRAYRDH